MPLDEGLIDTGLIVGEDGKKRCWWPGTAELYLSYHDREWGRPVADDRRLFEKLCFEGFQAGLSWLTVLRKRENFRSAFANFEIDKVARFGERQIAQCLEDAGIVRHRGKIESVINNARRARELREEAGSLGAFFWSFAPTERPESVTRSDIVPTTAESTALSKALRKRGWSFVGPTTMHAFMQAMGLVNDHLDGCFCRAEAEHERRAFKVPK